MKRNKKDKVLNLYAGLGGNRKLWTGVNVTAVENNVSIAKFYKDHFPNDKVVIGDANKYLLKNYKEFDFIWDSRPCPSHSRARFWFAKGNRIKPVFPDLKLYEEILFLKHYFDGRWVVENVFPYYKVLLQPTVKIDRHLFWSNFYIKNIIVSKNIITEGNIKLWENEFGFNISGYKFNIRKDKVLRNCVLPKIGLHIYNESKRQGMFKIKELL